MEIRIDDVVYQGTAKETLEKRDGTYLNKLVIEVMNAQDLNFVDIMNSLKSGVTKIDLYTDKNVLFKSYTDYNTVVLIDCNKTYEEEGTAKINLSFQHTEVA